MDITKIILIVTIIMLLAFFNIVERQRAKRIYPYVLENMAIKLPLEEWNETKSYCSKLLLTDTYALAETIELFKHEVLSNVKFSFIVHAVFYQFIITANKDKSLSLKDKLSVIYVTSGADNKELLKCMYEYPLLAALICIQNCKYRQDPD